LKVKTCHSKLEDYDNNWIKSFGTQHWLNSSKWKFFNTEHGCDIILMHYYPSDLSSVRGNLLLKQTIEYHRKDENIDF
jgi:hypothetical protein